MASPRRNFNKKPDDRLEHLLSSAKAHGEVHEEQEIGDLIDLVRLMWASLSVENRKRVHDAFFESHEDWSKEVA